MKKWFSILLAVCLAVMSATFAEALSPLDEFQFVIEDDSDDFDPSDIDWDIDDEDDDSGSSHSSSDPFVDPVIDPIFDPIIIPDIGPIIDIGDDHLPDHWVDENPFPAVNTAEAQLEATPVAGLMSLFPFNEVYVSRHESYGNRKPTGFIYNDGFLLMDNSQLSPELAKCSVALASAAYCEDDIQYALGQMGGFSIDTYNYDKEHTYEDNDWVRFVIARKEITLPGETNPYFLYCLPIQGTKGSFDWYSDFNIGSGDDHEGFYTARREVMYTLYDMVAADDAVDKDHRIFWIMGHSRGAAVANIVAGELTSGNIPELGLNFSYYVSPGRVFGYTFACPGVSKNANASYDNIYSFNNIDDLIPTLPPKDWHYKRYGRTITLSSEDRLNMARQFNRVYSEEYFGNVNTPNYIDSIFLTLIPNTENSGSYASQLLLKGFGYLMSVKDDFFGRFSFHDLFEIIGYDFSESFLEKLKRIFFSSDFGDAEARIDAMMGSIGRALAYPIVLEKFVDMAEDMSDGVIRGSDTKRYCSFSS